MLKSMGVAHFRTNTPPKPPTNFDVTSNITTSLKGVDVQNLVGIDSAVTDLSMREKTRFCVDFFINIIKFIYLSVRYFVVATDHSFVAILALTGSNDVIPQPLVPLVGTLILLLTTGVRPPKPQLAFSSQTHKTLKLSYYEKYCNDSYKI